MPRLISQLPSSLQRNLREMGRKFPQRQDDAAFGLDELGKRQQIKSLKPIAQSTASPLADREIFLRAIVPAKLTFHIMWQILPVFDNDRRLTRGPHLVDSFDLDLTYETRSISLGRIFRQLHLRSVWMRC